MVLPTIFTNTKVKHGMGKALVQDRIREYMLQDNIIGIIEHMLRDKIMGKNEEVDFVVDVGHIKSQCALAR